MSGYWATGRAADDQPAAALDGQKASQWDAQNSMEKMLAHQMAAVHKVTMILAAEADLRHQRLASSNLGYSDQDLKTVEAFTKLTGAMARSSVAFQDGLLALQKLRSCGSQRIVVQHVTVSDGGQAVVTGEMKTEGGGQRSN